MIKKICYYDTDCGGVVYYANYLKYFEEARGEYLEKRGIFLKELSQKGIWFVVRKVDIDYFYPARYGDILTINSQISKVKNVSFYFYQEALVGQKDKLLVSAHTQLVCVDSNFKPLALSDEILTKLKSKL